MLDSAQLLCMRQLHLFYLFVVPRSADSLTDVYAHHKHNDDKEDDVFQLQVERPEVYAVVHEVREACRVHDLTVSQSTPGFHVNFWRVWRRWAEEVAEFELVRR